MRNSFISSSPSLNTNLTKDQLRENYEFLYNEIATHLVKLYRTELWTHFNQEQEMLELYRLHYKNSDKFPDIDRLERKFKHRLDDMQKILEDIRRSLQ